MKRVSIVAATVAGVAIAGALAGGVVVMSGVYDISATDQHLAPTYWLLDTAMRRSIRSRSEHIAVPSLDDPAKTARGLALFRQHCVQCHGAPGVAPEPFALGMTPTPANLAYTGRDWPPRDLYYVIRQGIKMTGMPAWEFRLSDDDIWSVVAFMKRLPALSPQQYRELKSPDVAPPVEANAPRVAPAGVFKAPDAPPATVQSDAAEVGRGKRDAAQVERAKSAIHQYACATCHRIPGIAGANVPVGPPLDRIGTRAVIAGVLPNTPDNMVRWLRRPQQVKPASAMPDLGLTERDARDIAGYLSRLQ